MNRTLCQYYPHACSSVRNWVPFTPFAILGLTLSLYSPVASSILFVSKPNAQRAQITLKLTGTPAASASVMLRIEGDSVVIVLVQRSRVRVVSHRIALVAASFR